MKKVFTVLMAVLLVAGLVISCNSDLHETEFNDEKIEISSIVYEKTEDGKVKVTINASEKANAYWFRVGPESAKIDDTWYQMEGNSHDFTESEIYSGLHFKVTYSRKGITDETVLSAIHDANGWIIRSKTSDTDVVSRDYLLKSLNDSYYLCHFEKEKCTETVSGTLLASGFKATDKEILFAKNISGTEKYDSVASLIEDANALKAYVQNGDTYTQVERNIGTADEKTYTVKFSVPASATDNPIDQQVKAGEKVVKPSDPKMEDYTFTTWYKTEDYTSGTEWVFSIDVVTKDITLYGKFVPNNTITYLANGATSGTENIPVDPAFYKDGEVAVIKGLTGAVERTGHTLTSPTIWRDTEEVAEGVTQYYSAGQYVTMTDALVLYANWKADTYNVGLDPNGGVITSGSDVTSYTYGVGAKLPDATKITRTGYTFGGWFDNAQLEGTAVTEISTTDTGNKDYWAKWTANKYTVKFDNNATTASGTMADMTMTYDKETTLTDNAFTNGTKIFSGWNTKSDGQGTAYANKAVVKNLTSKNGDTVTLYAQWSDGIPYRYPVYNTEGVPKSGIKEWKTGTCTSYTDVTTGVSSDPGVTWNAGWYVISGGTEESPIVFFRITCNGDVNIILKDDSYLNVGNRIVCSFGNSVTIYGQENGTGCLKAVSSGSGASGIGANDSTTPDSGTITINGGIVTATGYSCIAGIGGYSGYGSSGFISGKGADITINDGTVTANGGSCAAGIGGGEGGAGSNITINGGDVTANGVSGAAGIGGGKTGAGSNITINGGTVTATGGSSSTGAGSGIGGGQDGSASGIYASSTLTVKAGNNNPPTTSISHTSTQDIAGDLADKLYCTVGIN